MTQPQVTGHARVSFRGRRDFCGPRVPRARRKRTGLASRMLGGWEWQREEACGRKGGRKLGGWVVELFRGWWKVGVIIK